MAAILLSLPEGADDKNIIRTVRFGETMVYIIKWLLLWRQPYLWGHAVVPSGVQRGQGRTGRRPRASEARGASTEWKYKTWNAVTWWFFLLFYETCFVVNTNFYVFKCQ